MIRFYRKKLKNGMVVLFEKRGGGVVSAAFATRFGSINENPGEKGIAHFIEHMLYKGTPMRNAKQISEEIEKRGGILNGFTGEQVTAFWCKIPSRHLMVALNVLSDMIKNPLFDKKEVEKERKVIFEEMKLYKDSPSLHAHDKILSCLYKGTLGMPPIGTKKTLNTINRKKLKRKFRQVYSTNNLTLCIVGDANFNEICNFSEKSFKKTRFEIPKKKIILHNRQSTEKRKGIDQANLIFAYHVPNAGKKEHYAAQLLNILMAGGMSSRLFEEIREKRNLAYVVKGSCNADKDFGFNSIYIGTKKENAEIVKEIIIKEFKKIKSLGLKEFNETKEQLIGNNKISKEDSSGQMVELLYCENFGNVKEAYEYEKKVKEIKIEDVKKLANFKKYSFFALIPA